MAVTPTRLLPTSRLGSGRLAAINAFWFGGGAHWQPIYTSLIPVGATLGAASRADLLIGRVTAAGGIFALLPVYFRERGPVVHPRHGHG